MIYRASFGTPFRHMHSPLYGFERIRRQMNSLFETLSEQPSRPMTAGVYPLINLTETKNDYIIQAELPGVKKDSLDINVNENTLTISGERKISTENDHATYHRREREAGKFSRAIAMPGDIETDGVEATLAKGILTVTVPKGAKAKPRQITIH